MEFILFLGKTAGSCLLHCLKMFHANFGCKIQQGYRVMSGGIFCDASTVLHMCEIITGQGSRNCKGVH